MSFESFALHSDLLRNVQGLGFIVPTPIQKDAIPPALEGRDLLACAVTGSGKTAAFLLPTLHRLMRKPRGVTRALVLTPTRELAAQIEEHARQLAARTPLTVASVFGGVSMGPQEQALRRGVDVVVATPGRLLDHFRFPYAGLKALEVLVLDEADRMLDMGFLPDIRRILGHLPAKRQTLLFSATIPQEIAGLARERLDNPVSINIERKAAPAAGITHVVHPVSQERKATLLLELLKSGKMKSVLVFTRTKHRADRIARFLSSHGISCERIHGNRTQAQRTAAMAGFKKGKYRVLVATDIAARGIDIIELSHVVNFDLPNAPEDYIHRVGRTARAEATGDAFTFVSPEEESGLSTIERAVGRRFERTILPGFDTPRYPRQTEPSSVERRIAAFRPGKSHTWGRPKNRDHRHGQASTHGRGFSRT